MTPETMWRDRLDDLRTEHGHCRSVIDGMVRGPLPALAESLAMPLGRLDGSLTDLQRSGAGAQPEASMWRMLAGVRRTAEDAFRMTLQTIGGLSLAGVGDGAGQPVDPFVATAQAWLDKLRTRVSVNRPLVVVPGLGPLVDVRLGLVQAPFLDSDIWNLPLLARAVGMLAAEEDDGAGGSLGAVVGALTPEVSDMLAGSATRHVHALFADMVTTVAVGPAYPVALFALELDYAVPDTYPADAAGSAPLPSPVERAAAVLATLREMNQTAPTAQFEPEPYRAIVERLEDLWAQALPTDGRERLTEARQHFDPWYGLLLETAVLPRFGAVAQDTGAMWARTTARCRAWAAGHATDPSFPGPDMTEVANLLWRYRLDVPDREDILAAAAEELLAGGDPLVPTAADRRLSTTHLARMRIDRSRGRCERLAALMRPPLTSAIVGRMLRLLSEQLHTVGKARQAVTAADGPPPDWAAIRCVVQGGIPVLREGLELLGGGLLVRAGRDRPAPADAARAPRRVGVCALADRLLAEYAERTGVGWAASSVLGGEPLLEAATDVVRVRFPDWSIWDLALVAHEFGHIVARDTPAFGSRRAEWVVGQPPEVGAQLEELFADIFGVYALGPAFACDAIVLHLDPANAGMSRGSHPPHGLRADVILRTLGLMNDTARGAAYNAGPYDQVITLLRTGWAQACRLAGDAALTSLLPSADELLDLVVTYYHLGAEYRPDRWAWARKTAIALSPDPPSLRDLCVEAAAEGLDRVDLSDLMNLLWCARMEAVAPLRVLTEVGANLANEYMEARDA
jgi:hypothetical protein